ncbi:MAG: YhcH/YjgK/YiaL family protein [Nitrospinae bacterium]|nr:YhcH/YjgK/YiaL family protein [Nitrospinota bacterium]
MIMDKIENAGRYFSPDSPMAAGIEFVRRAAREDLPDGRYEVGGEGAYATVQTYLTESAKGKRPETHRKYADIQALIKGREIIGWLPAKGLEKEKEYDPERDVEFHKNSADETRLLLKPGLFAVFYPADAHKPGCSAASPEVVRKVVVKIPV